MNELVFLSSKGNPITDSLMIAKVFGKRPTQRSMNMRLFRIVEHKPKEGFSMEPTTKVTGKGQEYFINKFLKELVLQEKH